MVLLLLEKKPFHILKVLKKGIASVIYLTSLL